MNIKQKIFNEILLSLGGYPVLKKSLKIKGCCLARGAGGELIMNFDGCEFCNKVVIRLCRHDSCYSMNFYRFSFASFDRGSHIVKTFENIHRQKLRRCFEDFTALSLTTSSR